MWEVLLQKISIEDKWICKQDVQREATGMQMGDNLGFQDKDKDKTGTNKKIDAKDIENKNCMKVLIFHFLLDINHFFILKLESGDFEDSTNNADGS